MTVAGTLALLVSLRLTYLAAQFLGKKGPWGWTRRDSVMGHTVTRTEPSFSVRMGELGLIEAVASWCEALQGQATLNEGLQAICKALGADAAAIVRVRPDSGKPGRTICFDMPGRGVEVCPLNRSFGISAMGSYLTHARPATVWHVSMITEDPDPALTRFQGLRGFAEMTIVPLAQSSRGTDLLEFHFRHALDASAQALINFFASTLVRSWDRRQPGLFLESLLESAAIMKTADDTGPILSIENSCRLSRAEYRVCLLLSRGLSKEGLLGELSISKSTLRTHLRNIFIKTNTQNQTELMYRLLARVPAIVRPGRPQAGAA